MGQYIFGVDIGGTSVKMGLFDRAGGLLEKWEIPTRTEDAGKNILTDVAESIKAKTADRQISREAVLGVGIGTPGLVDKDGIVYRPVNLGWGVVNIPQIMSERLGRPVYAANDANMAALGEMWKGGGQGGRNLVMVTLGTGVGGGIIVDGRMLIGAAGAGGEIGHIHVEDAETECCGCGSKGCLEQYTSATGITRLANRMLKATDAPSVLRGRKMSAKTVFDGVKEQDQLAAEIAKQFGEYLGKALGVIAGIINPEVFVIGGGVSKAGNILFDYVVPYYNQTVFSGCRDVKFALATLGNDAGIYGAARLVLDQENSKGVQYSW